MNSSRDQIIIQERRFSFSQIHMQVYTIYTKICTDIDREGLHLIKGLYGIIIAL